MSKRSHALSLCRSRLLSALRTALACTFVGLATAYSPSTLSRHLKFPALSYVVATLIFGNNATLGSTLTGAAEALCGMTLGLLPAAMVLYMVRPEGISAVTSAAAVAMSAFAVSVSEWAGLIAKRVALAQIVIVYVTACKEAAEDGRVAAMHPVPVAVSTAIGAAAAVLALVVPYPRLACYEVRERSRCYTELTVERFRLFLSAFCADNSNCMDAFIFRAKSLTVTCNKLLQKIKLMQGSMKWEIPPLKFLQPYLNAPWDRLQAIEAPLKGMEMALSSTTSPPFKILNEQPHFKEKMISLRDKMLSSNLDQETNFMADQNHMIDKTIQSFNLSSTNLQHLPSLFFIFCMQLLCNGETLTSPSPNHQQESKVAPATEQQSANSCKQVASPTDKKSRIRSALSMNLSNKKILIALKCSLSLSLAVLFSVLFKRDNAYWSGLTVAFAFTPSRESTFKLASLRAHGTALGSVFGVLASFISQNLMEVRLVALIPFIIFTSFLQSSRMYGQAGASSAAISAMIILGRRIDGSPMLFSIERLTECYIGLCCSMLIEVLLQPTRAATLARSKVSECLEMLNGCIESVTNTAELKEKEKKLRRSVNELKKYVAEAELEPNFWFLPFPAVCYKRLHGSLLKTVDLLLFTLHGVDVLIKDSKEMEETMKINLDQFKELVGAQVKCLKDVVRVKSVATLEKELECKSSRNHDDIEAGKLGQEILFDEEKVEEFVSSFLQHSSEVVDNRLDQEVGVEMMNKQVLCFAAVGFCVGGLIREVREMEKGVVEIVQSENTSKSC